MTLKVHTHLAGRERYAIVSLPDRASFVFLKNKARQAHKRLVGRERCKIVSAPLLCGDIYGDNSPGRGAPRRSPIRYVVARRSNR